jgi:glyoxylase-like metal-dependent hydrolase (beta-lactamase superfamily II)
VKADVVADCEGTFATLREALPAIHSDVDWWIPVNCALLRSGGATVLVDTGAGPKPRPFMPDGEAALLDALARLGVAPDDVDVVVHTHLHVDHVGWTGSFPNARYVVHEDDWAYFMSEPSLAERPHLREKVLPLERVEHVAAEVEIAPGICVQPAPGHTPGHMIVRAEGLAVIGDAAAHELQIADPDLVFVNDMDPDVAAATRRRLIPELAAEGAAVIAGHFRGIGRFEPSGRGYCWASGEDSVFAG